MVEFKKTFYLLCISLVLYNITHWNKCFVEGSAFVNVTWTSSEKYILRKIEVKHIMSHVAETTGKDYSAEEMEDRIFRFYFFRFHDDNGDNLLDGLELVQSVIHFYDEVAILDPTVKVEAYPDEVLAAPVDNLLEAHDSNNDGFLDYLEFTVDAPLELR